MGPQAWLDGCNGTCIDGKDGAPAGAEIRSYVASAGVAKNSLNDQVIKYGRLLFLRNPYSFVPYAKKHEVPVQLEPDSHFLTIGRELHCVADHVYEYFGEQSAVGDHELRHTRQHFELVFKAFCLCLNCVNFEYMLKQIVHIDVFDRQACMEAGMNDFVAKPIEPGKLFAAIIDWLPERT